jgi:hypothetical protein
MEGDMLWSKGRNEVVRVIKSVLQSDFDLILASSILLGSLLQCLRLTRISSACVLYSQLPIFQELISRSCVYQDMQRPLWCI